MMPKSKHEQAEQGKQWSKHASKYDDLFLDPFREGVVNPLLPRLADWPGREKMTAIDLGCGVGPLLPWLLPRFQRLIALDFAPNMITKSKARLGSDAERVEFHCRPMDQLDEWQGQIDVAIAFNSIVMPDTRIIDRTLRSIRGAMKPDGLFAGIMPSMDAIHYHTMLLYDLALDRENTLEEAERYASFNGEHHYYDFAFGRFDFRGLKQKFWQPFEIEHRLTKAGFGSIELLKVLYPWDDQLAGAEDFQDKPQSWDWAFMARPC